MPEHFCQPHPRLEGKSQSLKFESETSCLVGVCVNVKKFEVHFQSRRMFLEQLYEQINEKKINLATIKDYLKKFLNSMLVSRI